MRPYKIYTWQEVLRVRDSLQILKDIAIDKSREWDLFDEELSFVNDEIDIRYKEKVKSEVIVQ